MTNKGFSLIELMIVVVIISVLTMVAIPTYKDYVIRAKVSNLMALAEPSKLAVTEALASGRPATANVIENQGVAQRITVVADGSITIVGNSEALGIMPREPALQITLRPSLEQQDFVIWECAVVPEGLQKYAPAECRQ